MENRQKKLMEHLESRFNKDKMPVGKMTYIETPHMSEIINRANVDEDAIRNIRKHSANGFTQKFIAAVDFASNDEDERTDVNVLQWHDSIKAKIKNQIHDHQSATYSLLKKKNLFKDGENPVLDTQIDYMVHFINVLEGLINEGD